MSSACLRIALACKENNTEALTCVTQSASFNEQHFQTAHNSERSQVCISAETQIRFSGKYLSQVHSPEQYAGKTGLLPNSKQSPFLS